MGVDGIDKADIFDEYFDDEKPKVTNFQRIKAMDIDEMARWLTQFVNLDCYDCNDSPNCDSCYKENKLWLESEVRE